MSHDGKEKLSFFWNFVLEFRSIIGDVLFVYQHFFHWTISRILISVWSIVLGILVSVPFFLFAVLMAWIDPISWLAYFQDTADTHVVFDHLASHPYWFVSILFLLLTSAIVFLLASSYSLLLMARLSYKYTQRKLLDYTKNLYLSWRHIVTFMSLFSLNFVYILAPVMIWCGWVFFVYFFYHAEHISFSFLSYSLLALTLILIFAVAYVSYRILFWYIVLATEKDLKNILKARKYLHHSIKITRGKNILKFFFLLAIYALITFPFQYIDTTLNAKVQRLKDALEFRVEKINNIDAANMPYYEFLNEEYKGYSDTQIVDSIMKYSWVSVAYFIFYTLVFGWLFVTLLTSFYVRVLEKDYNNA